MLFISDTAYILLNLFEKNIISKSLSYFVKIIYQNYTIKLFPKAKIKLKKFLIHKNLDFLCHIYYCFHKC